MNGQVRWSRVAVLRRGECFLNRSQNRASDDVDVFDAIKVALYLAAVAFLALLTQATTLQAQPPIVNLNDPHKVIRITIPQNKSTTVQLGRAYQDVLVGNEKIADIVPLTTQSMYILGKEIGTTRLVIVDEQKELLGVIEVEVSYDVTELNAKIKEIVPYSQITATSVNGKVMLSGMSPDAPSMATVLEIAKQFAPETAVTNATSVNTSQQVMLEVRFLEVSRTAGRELGVNLLARSEHGNFSGSTGQLTGAGQFVQQDVDGAGNVFNIFDRPPLISGNRLGTAVDVVGLVSGSAPFGTMVQRLLSNGATADVVVQALEERGLARRLAEPNLVALSGDTANFLAGGEFPFPVPQGDDTITIQFKKFGVGLAFTPTVLANGGINLKVDPEVSELDPANSVTIRDATIPGLVVRRASTTLELRDGQSFAMAGLLQFDNRKAQRQVPWIGQVPVLGALFRSASYQKNESDLVIIVTPRLVKPARPDEHLVSPLEKSRPTNDVEFFLLGKQERWETKVRKPDLQAGHNITFEDEALPVEGGRRGFFK